MVVIEMWGDGDQTRSFLYVDECVEGSIRLMRSEWEGPVILDRRNGFHK